MHVTSRSWLALAGFIAATFLAAGMGGLFTGMSVSGWYLTLQKPTWTPPSWLFGPVWTMLYLGMSVAAWLVWRERATASVTRPLSLFALQLALNAIWPGLFFALRNPGLALVEILALWLSILVTMIFFERVNKWAGWLLAPYLAWVTFATALNFEIWRLNI